MNAARSPLAERPSTRRFGAAIAGISLLVAVLVQLSLRFYLGFSWFWSIVIGVAVLIVIGLLAALPVLTYTYAREAGVIWVFGNLRPLDLRNLAEPSRTAARTSGRPARPMPHDWRETLSVQINTQSFSLGGPFDAEKLFFANFEKAGSVARVRAAALPGQTMLIANQCVVRTFGDEFIVTPLAKGDISSPVTSDTTAFLFFAEPDPSRPIAPIGLERITIVVAGGWLTLDLVTKRFVDLASELFGEPHRGSRGQRIWHAGDLCLVCEVEQYKELHRSTFIWTTEDFHVGEAG